MWDLTSGERQVLMHSKWCDAVVFSPNGTILASASRDKTVSTYMLKGCAWERRLRLMHAAPVISVAFAPDGSTLAAASASVVVIWHAHSGERMQELTHGCPVYRIAFSAASSQCTVLASACYDGSVHCFQVLHQELRMTAILRGHEGVVRALCFSPCGCFLVSASDDGNGIVWATAAARFLSALHLLRAQLRILHRSGHHAEVPEGSQQGTGRGAAEYWIARVCYPHLLPENAVGLVLHHVRRLGY